MIGSHSVLLPEAKSPPVLVVPGKQDTQVFDNTLSFTPHTTGLHDVSTPEASSPASFDVPAGQSEQVLDNTLSLASHRVGVHSVLLPDASSPPTFVVPACGVGSKRWMKKEGEYLDLR